MSLSVQNLSFKRGQRSVLKNISLSVEAGQLVALVGNNGTGKSTLMNCISSELQPESGQVTFNGQPLSQWKTEQRARMMAMLSQNTHLQFDFPVRDVVAMGRYPHSSGAHRDQEIVASALHFCDAYNLRDKTYTELSGGEQRRVQLARVIAQLWEPVNGGHRLLLLDEPVNGLDLAHQHQLFNRLRKIADKGVAVLFVVHDLNLAARYANQIAVMYQGALANFGSPERVLTRENIERYFNLEVEVQSNPYHSSPIIIPV